MKKLILSFLLHHANRYRKCEHFYDIKGKILEKYATLIDYHYQFIAGKKCHTCGGSGIYTSYSWHTNRPYHDTCRNCWGGWYIPNKWNVLAVYQFGKYRFHKPTGTQYKKPECQESQIIDGYVNHEPSSYSYVCRMLIYLLFDLKGYKKRWVFGWGGGWYPYQQWKPKHAFNNLAHLIKNGNEAIPFKVRRMKKIMPLKRVSYQFDEFDDLPF